jgi:hypothetical protein
MLGKILGFNCMHENKIFFFVFWENEINLKVLKIFYNFFRNISKKAEYFNTKFVSYSVNL